MQFIICIKAWMYKTTLHHDCLGLKITMKDETQTSCRVHPYVYSVENIEHSSSINTTKF